MLDDIDYGDLSASAEPTPRKKSAISERKLSSKSESKPTPKPIDTAALAEKATSLQEGLGAPEIGDPLAQYGLPGLGVLGGLATAYGLYQASKNKPTAPATPPSVVGGVPAASSVQYTTAAPQQTMQYGQQTMNAPVGVPAPADIPPAPPTIDEQIKMEKLKQAQLRTAALEKASQPKPAGTPIAAADTIANVAPETVKPAPTVADLASRVEAGKQVGLGLKKTEVPAVTQLAEQPITSPTLGEAIAPKKRAPKTEQKTYKAVPEGHVFIPEMGNLDQGMQNIYGEEGRKYARDLLNEGKHFGSAPKGKGEYNKALQELSAKYMQALQGQIPQTILSREERIAQGVPHGKIGTYGGLGKIAKVAGVTGTLLAAAEAAKAAQQGDYVGAAKTAIPALDPIGYLGAAVNPEESAKTLATISPVAGILSQLLGSKAEEKAYAKKVGAGRGIAPPSAYQR